MKQTLKKFWILFLLIAMVGCAQTRKGPPAQTTVLPDETEVAPEQTVTPFDETEVASEQSVTPFDETVESPEQIAEPSKETTVPPKKTVVTPKQTVAPPKKTVVPPKKTTVPTKQARKKTEKQKLESMHPEERHIWLPPNQKELKARRERQKHLDVVASDLERLFMGYADILGDEIMLENLLRGKEPELQKLEAQTGQKLTDEEKRVEKMKKVLKEIEGSVKEMDASLEEIRKERAAQKTPPIGWSDDYRLAILLFRDGQYRKSIAKFKSILEKKYPRSLKDNILFGLASNYYKLKEYDKALAHLTTIIQRLPKGDKWLVSHAISGLIYNLQGKPGKAIPILESTLQHKPNPELLKIINRLLKLAKESVTDASS
jgi:tetratricopeptide (TPR) repeat protein